MNKITILIISLLFCAVSSKNVGKEIACLQVGDCTEDSCNKSGNAYWQRGKNDASKCFIDDCDTVGTTTLTLQICQSCSENDYPNSVGTKCLDFNCKSVSEWTQQKCTDCYGSNYLFSASDKTCTYNYLSSSILQSTILAIILFFF